MRRDDLAALSVFLVIAEEQSFGRAAGRLGLDRSAVSHTLRRLEERLRTRLIDRTTRFVSITESGQRLVERIAPAVRELEQRLADLDELIEKSLSPTVRRVQRTQS